MAKILLNAAAKYRTYASAKFRVLWIRIGFNADPAFFYQYGSGSKEPNHCGCMRILIQILVRLQSKKKLNIYMKNIL
jgi:hypothetical protein